jgi:hypothetical protein
VRCANREGFGGDLPSDGRDPNRAALGGARLTGNASTAGRGPVSRDEGDVLPASAFTTIGCVLQQRSASVGAFSWGQLDLQHCFGPIAER